MFTISKNTKNKKIFALVIAGVLVIAGITLWQFANKSEFKRTESSSTDIYRPSYYPFIILNITGDRAKDGIEGNLTDSIQVLEITIALNNKYWTNYSNCKTQRQYEKLEVNFSEKDYTTYSEMVIWIDGTYRYYFGDVFTVEKWNGTDGVFNNTTGKWDIEPIGNLTTTIEKIEYGIELNAKNVGLTDRYFAYSLRDKDNSFDNGDRIYDKEDRHIMNEDDIIKIIINVGDRLKNQTQFEFRLPDSYNLSKHGIDRVILPKYEFKIKFTDERYVYFQEGIIDDYLPLQIKNFNLS